MKLYVSIILILLTVPAFADNDHLVRIDTRAGVAVPVYYMKHEGATATVVLLTGGNGNIQIKNGIPTSRNFLVRSRDLFAANGFNVAVVDRPTDATDLDGSFRISPEHVEDLRGVIAFLKKDAAVPVWLVGTSMGTISATAAAIALGGKELAGIVLSSSITSQKRTGAVPWQNLEAIRVPVLVLHHEFDACKVCVPGDVPLIVQRLKNAPIKKAIYVKGGENPSGNPCEAMHWHGYIGMEKEAVGIISSWIKSPAP
jgi:pimeloyl-ACP methyl ester carboxylesterase